MKPKQTAQTGGQRMKISIVIIIILLTIGVIFWNKLPESNTIDSKITVFNNISGTTEFETLQGAVDFVVNNGGMLYLPQGEYE